MAKTKRINPNTKYYPPRLVKKLEYIQSYPFTLIEAPSGFGKTTLIEYFFESRITPAVPRYNYDFETDEPLFIWKEICQRIWKIDADCGEKLLQCGPPDEDNLPELRQILKELRCSGECYLWFDNYKRWNNEFSGEFLSFLSQHGGKNLHIIVSSQPLAPDKKKKSGLTAGCWRMGDEDLVFRKEDIAAYFTAAGITLSNEEIRQVSVLTEGWIMALSLQMLCYLNCGEFEHGGMMALMEHTFWDHLTEAEKDFLLKISVFKKFSLAQATALFGLGTEKTDQMLRDKRYFIHFDSENRFFYPHSQLRSLLNEHFSCLPREEQKAIYRKAAELCSEEGDRINTLRFYYYADSWEQIFKNSLTSYEIADIINEETRPMVLDILERAPMEVKLRYPQSMISLAFALFIMGENQRLKALHGEIIEIIRKSEISPEEQNELMGEMELLLSFLEYNRISDMSARHKKALELLKGPAKLISPRSIWTFGSPSILYLYWRESGKLDEELEEMDSCMPIYYQLSGNHGAGAELLMRAEAHMVRGEVDKALPLCYQALFVSANHHQDSISQCGLFLLCRIAVMKKDRETLHTTLEHLKEISQKHREDLSRYTYDLAEGFLDLLENRPDDIAPWIAAGDISEKRLAMMVQPGAYIVYGRYLVEKKEYMKLLGAGKYFMSLSQIFPNLMPQVYIHIYNARAYEALEDHENATKELQMAVDLAIPDRIYTPFAENLAGMQQLFQTIRLGSRHRKKIEELAGLIPERQEEKAEDFTPRERQILALIKDDLNNREIGERMGLSPNTIRNVVSTMLRKRNVKTRQQLKKFDE